MPSNGLTATVSGPAHHNIQEVSESQHSCQKAPLSSDPNTKAKFLSPHTIQNVSLVHANEADDQGEALPDTLSASNDEQPLEILDPVPGHVEDGAPLHQASHSSVDSIHETLAGSVEFTHQPSPASLSTTNPDIAVSDSIGSVHNETKAFLRLPIAESLGLWACTTLSGGTLITLAVLGFLVFLWAGEGPPGGEKATYVWRKIMLNESWPAQTITICAVVVRTIAAAQAAVCTSLVAALLLERRRLPLSKAVPVSIKRGINDGPFNLVRDLLSWKVFRRLFCLEMALLILVTIVTFGIQFTSTLLLSGFDTTTLIEFPQQLHRNVILSAETAQKASGLNSFSQFPPSYALFGELETSDSPDPNPRGVSDTGVKLRSFVPFLKEERAKLRSYTGPAFSERTQLMCVRPSMDAQVSWDIDVTELGSLPVLTITGIFSYDKTFEEAGLDDWEPCSSTVRLDGSEQTACLPSNFTCTLPLNSNGTITPSSVIALCHPPTTFTRSTGKSNMGPQEMWNDSRPLWSADANPWMYLTFSTNLTVGAVNQEIEGNKSSTVSLDVPVAKPGEWNTYQLLPAMTLNVTLCFAGLYAELFEVSMSTAADPQEPEVRWDFTDLDDGASPGQRFMGTTGSNLSITERGILSITDVRDPSTLKREDVMNSSLALWAGPFAFTGMFSGQSGGSWMMCNFCDFYGWAIPPDIAALFARTIHTTGRAGWAIQTFLTTYTQSWYAQILPEFDVAADIDVTFSTQLRIPRHWGGLTAALVLVCVNLVCVWALTVLYVVHTRCSRQGNVWHTVSQIMSEDTKTVLEKSNQVKDKRVEKELEEDDYLVFIGRPKGSEKVSLIRY
jgi:hypothetical protein